MVLLCYPHRCDCDGFLIFTAACIRCNSKALGKNQQNHLPFWVSFPLSIIFFDYATNVYTSLLYSGSKVVVEFLGFVLCTTYLLFLFLYFKQYEEQQETLHQNQLMELMRDQSQKDLVTLHQAQQSVSIMRHDMRHFLLAISSMIENDKRRMH